MRSRPPSWEKSVIDQLLHLNIRCETKYRSVLLLQPQAPVYESPQVLRAGQDLCNFCDTCPISWFHVYQIGQDPRTYSPVNSKHRRCAQPFLD